MKKFIILLAAVMLMSQKGEFPLPQFQIVNIQNNSVLNNASLKGKVVLFNFWEIDDQGMAQQEVLKKIANKYPHKLFVLSACVTKKSKTDLQIFVQEKGWDHAIAKAKRGFKDLSYLKEYPYTLVVDSTGNILQVEQGLSDLESLEKDIAPYLVQADEKPVIPVLPEIIETPAKKNEATQEKQPILIYGRPGCYNCKDMAAFLDSEGKEYKIMNVDADPAINSEMWQKVFMFKYNSSQVKLPVLDINGHILVHPNFDQVKSTLKKKAFKYKIFSSVEKLALDTLEGKTGKEFSDYSESQDTLLTGLMVFYSKDFVRGIKPIFTKAVKGQNLGATMIYHDENYGGYGTANKWFNNPGYYISGIRLCEQVTNGVVVIKKMGVIWKKWNDEKAAPVFSEYVGSKSDAESCIEIQVPQGKAVIGIHGKHIPKQTLNQLSLVISDVDLD